LSTPAEALDAIFDGADSTCAPGGVIAVRQAGAMLCRRGYGMASIEHGIANTPATRMRIGSSSKQFACMAALLLAEDGKLDLDAPVDRWVPGLPGFPTVPSARQLMNHTSGYRDHLDAAGLANGGAKIPDGWTMQVIARQTGANFAPGNGQTYCNAGYHLLSAVIDAAAGERFEDVLDRRIFKPLGMTATASQPSDYAITPDLATLHVPLPGGGWRRGLFPTEEIRGEGAMVATVDDLMLWLAELKGPHRLASAESWRMMTDAPLLPDGTRSIYALGLHRHTYRGVEVIHHAGGVIGGAAQVMHVPAHDLDIVMLSNGGMLQPLPTVWRILDTLLESELSPPLPPLASAADFAHLEGAFFGGSDGTLMGFGALGEVLGISFIGTPPFPILRDHGDRLVVAFEESALGPLVIETASLAAPASSQPPEHIVFSESGRRQSLHRLTITEAETARIGSALGGNYHSIDLAAEATITPGHPAPIAVRGEFGQVAGAVRILSEDFAVVTEAGADLPSAAIQFERDGGRITGFRISAPRSRGLRFERQG
jgi:CubicO group peptidase (beta-lactamase class C family)